MPSPNENKAAILADAAKFGDATAAKMHGASVGQIRTWRYRENKKKDRILPHRSLQTLDRSPITPSACDAAPSLELPTVMRDAVTLMESPDAEKTEDARPTGTATDEFLADLRGLCHDSVKVLRRALRGSAPVMEKAKIAIAAVEKLERAGRVPFGYGLPAEQLGQGNRTLINVRVHNTAGGSKRESLPDVIDVEAVQVPDVPPVTEPPQTEAI